MAYDVLYHLSTTNRGGLIVTTSNQRKAHGVARQTVLITGASCSIGKATDKKLLADGYSVYAAARRVEQIRDLEESGGDRSQD